jgi:MFS transporter, MHS family, proline/betaine transporter
MNARSRVRLAAAGTIGNVLEWYDFAIYGYFAVSIGHTFFPQGDRVAQVLAAFGAVGFYLMFLYIVSWLQLVDGVAPERALDINTASMAAMIPVMLAAGWLSDRVGRKPLLIAALALGFIGALPFLWLMHHANPALILVGQLGFVLTLGMANAITPALMVEATPPAVRCTAIAIGFNVTYGVLGGLSPLVATWLVHRTDIDLSPAFMVMAAAAVSFVAVLTFKESRPARGGGP